MQRARSVGLGDFSVALVWLAVTLYATSLIVMAATVVAYLVGLKDELWPPIPFL